MRPLDIGICGCGPAGLAAALLLHRDGHKVCLFERFETPGPVGSGLILQPTGLSVLAELGLAGEIVQRGAILRRLFGRSARSGRVVLDVDYAALGPGFAGLAVHRAVLFDVLFAAVRRDGIPVETGVPVFTSGLERGKRSVVAEGRAIAGLFDVVVDALGSRSPLSAGKARRLQLSYGALWANVPLPESAGFAGDALEQRYFRASRMAGILPLGRPEGHGSTQAAFFWSLKRQDFAAWREAGIESWKGNVRALWPEAERLLAGIQRPDDLTFAQYDHFTLPAPFGERLVHIGDSAHSTSPQLGQGANMALLDALALARGIRAGQDVFDCLQRYAKMRRLHVKLFQSASAVFTPFYQSDSRVLPWLRDRVAAPVSKLPIADRVLARLVSGLTVAPLAGEGMHSFRALAPRKRLIAPE